MGSRRTRKARFLLGLLGLLGLAAALLAGCTGDRAQEEEVVVYAAASLRDVLQELSEPFRQSSGVRPVFNFAGSNVLALQIEASPSADVYLSANEQWMDYLQEAGSIEPETRRTFASNRLVIVAHRSSSFELEDPARLAELDFSYLSLADPEAVPAGRYARQYLQSLDPAQDLWKRIKPRVAPAPDVRAALALVEADPQIAGIVYQTDAASSRQVKVLYPVPRGQGPDVRYWGALVKEGPHPRQGGQFLEFLSSARARGILEDKGFGSGAEE